MPKAAIRSKIGIAPEMLRSWVTLTRDLQWGGGSLNLRRVGTGMKVTEGDGGAGQTNQFEGCCYTKEERDGATGLAGWTSGKESQMVTDDLAKRFQSCRLVDSDCFLSWEATCLP